MDMHIYGSRQYQKAGAIDHVFGVLPCSEVADPPARDRNVTNTPVRVLNIFQEKGRAAFHDNHILTKPYSHAVFARGLEYSCPVREYKTFSPESRIY
jgi:hypothetical protein